jgi:hypothetical protein
MADHGRRRQKMAPSRSVRGPLQRLCSMGEDPTEQAGVIFWMSRVRAALETVQCCNMAMRRQRRNKGVLGGSVQTPLLPPPKITSTCSGGIGRCLSFRCVGKVGDQGLVWGVEGLFPPLAAIAVGRNGPLAPHTRCCALLWCLCFMGEDPTKQAGEIFGMSRVCTALKTLRCCDVDASLLEQRSNLKVHANPQLSPK